MNRFAPYFPALFCNSCSLTKQRINPNIKSCQTPTNAYFINFDGYIENKFKAAQRIKSCDLLYFDKQKVCFIELKAKDWFYNDDETLTSEQFFNAKKNTLERKILSSLQVLFDEGGFSKSLLKKYCVLFSKIAISLSKELDVQYLKRHIRYSLFMQFADYQTSNGSFLFSDANSNKYEVFLIADECSAIDEIINR
jgi:hypothetical protein